MSIIFNNLKETVLFLNKIILKVFIIFNKQV